MFHVFSLRSNCHLFCLKRSPAFPATRDNPALSTSAATTHALSLLKVRFAQCSIQARTAIASTRYTVQCHSEQPLLQHPPTLQRTPARVSLHLLLHIYCEVSIHIPSLCSCLVVCFWVLQSTTQRNTITINIRCWNISFHVWNTIANSTSQRTENSYDAALRSTVDNW